MVDAVLLHERVMTAIGLGESHFREFKSALHGPPGAKHQRAKAALKQDICEALVAFANADGGELVVGVEDDGEITGFVDRDHRLFQELLSSYKDGVYIRTPLSNVRAVHLLLDDKDVLYFSTSKSTTTIHQTSLGRCVQRRDLETVPISLEEIIFTRQERLSREYDRQFVMGAQADALDLDMVKALADQVSVGMSAEKCLQYLDLADFSDGYLKMRKATFLLFAKEPSKWHPRLQIRILKVSGSEIKSGEDYNISDEYIDGNIVTLVEKAWERLRPHLVQTRLTGSARFETRVMYPELACREALTNAIAHRDYSQEGRGIEIYVYDDRMEVKSPGCLLSSLSVNDLKRLEGAHQSRNSLVARVLREMGYMREVGEGMRRIFELMESNELAEPEILSFPEAFTVILHNKPIYRAEHQLWLDEFSNYPLSREQKAIIVLGYGGSLISPNDIWNSLGLQDTEHYRQLISSLQKTNILTTEVPKAKANRIKRAMNVNVRDIPRFRIQVPGAGSSPAGVSQAANAPRNRRIAASKRASFDRFDLNARIYIGNLPRNVKEDGLRGLMLKHSIDADVYIPRFMGNGKGYAFAQFENTESATSAIQTLSDCEFEGRRLVARPATRPMVTPGS